MINDVANRPPTSFGLALDQLSLGVNAVVLPVGRDTEVPDHASFTHLARPLAMMSTWVSNFSSHCSARR